MLRVLSGVYTGARKKSVRHGHVMRCFSPEAYSPCLEPLFLMVPLSHKLQAESVNDKILGERCPVLNLKPVPL